MPDMTFEAAADRRASLIRKGLKGAVLVGRYDDVDAVTTLIGTTAGQIMVPAGLESAGWLSEDGLSASSDRELSEIRGWGSASALRQDVTSRTETLSFSMLEDRRISRELYDAVDLRATEMSAEGELKYDLTDLPDLQYWRVVTIAVDGAGDNRVYISTAYHRCIVGEVEDVTESNGDDPTSRGVTLTALTDDDTGSLATRFIFGPGALVYADAMGYTVTPATP